MCCVYRAYGTETVRDGLSLESETLALTVGLGGAVGPTPNSPGVGITCVSLALGPNGSTTLAGPALFFILGREGQVPECLNHVFVAYSSRVF